MSVFDTFRIAASGMTAQRLRMDVAASNIANAESTRGASGGAYQPESVVFQATMMSASDPAPGVSATAVFTPATTSTRVYNPTHPDADASGFVSYPDVDIAAQVADTMGAARSYALNATVTSAAKQTAMDALEIGR